MHTFTENTGKSGLCVSIPLRPFVSSPLGSTVSCFGGVIDVLTSTLWTPNETLHFILYTR